MYVCMNVSDFSIISVHLPLMRFTGMTQTPSVLQLISPFGLSNNFQLKKANK